MQPGAKRGAGGVPRELPPDRDEHLLHDVRRIVRGAGEPPRYGAHQRVVAAHQSVEGSPVAATAPVDQSFILDPIAVRHALTLPASAGQ